MGIVVFVPGLRGERAATSITTDTVVGLNEQAIKRAARAANWDFYPMTYQTLEQPTPLLSAMELKIATTLRNLNTVHPDQPLLIVGSSVGFGVSLGALSQLQHTTSPIALLGIKPVPDPLLAITLQIGNPKVLEMLQNGSIPHIPLPVEGTAHTQEGPDIFPLTRAHINDPWASRLLSHQTSRHAFNTHAGGELHDCRIIYGLSDHLTPPTMMQHFVDSVVAVQTAQITYDGNHGTDISTMLQDTALSMMQDLDALYRGMAPI